MEGASFLVIKMSICEDDGKIRIRKLSREESYRSLTIPSVDPACTKCNPEAAPATTWFGKKCHTAICRRATIGKKAYLGDIDAVQRAVDAAFREPRRWDELTGIGERIEEKAFRSIENAKPMKVMFGVVSSLRCFQAILGVGGSHKVAEGCICSSYADAVQSLLEVLEDTIPDMAPPPYSP